MHKPIPPQHKINGKSIIKIAIMNGNATISKGKIIGENKINNTSKTTPKITYATVEAESEPFVGVKPVCGLDFLLDDDLECDFDFLLDEDLECDFLLEDFFGVGETDLETSDEYDEYVLI